MIRNCNRRSIDDHPEPDVCGESARSLAAYHTSQ
uniref:Uncharacterized protein n=1 Tax=Anopheles arabiensis TaxID=7173 RepID=A0A182IHE5_ANOAR